VRGEGVRLHVQSIIAAHSVQSQVHTLQHRLRKVYMAYDIGEAPTALVIVARVAFTPRVLSLFPCRPAQGLDRWHVVSRG